MSQYTVASVPYINAIPLVHSFESLGDETPVRVLYDVPAQLPDYLADGRADAILVSSVDALRVPNRRLAAGVCIGSDGPVRSVRLFSKGPLQEIATLALDASSMTSNRLAQILLSEMHGIMPRTSTQPPSLESMLQQADACVLIGDIGMSASADGLHVWDLGEAWHQLTGLPFVWAGWIGNDRLTPELVGLLADAADAQSSPAALTNLVQVAKGRTHLPDETIASYYRDVMIYNMDDRMLQGFAEFQRRLLANGFSDCKHTPEIVDRR